MTKKEYPQISDSSAKNRELALKTKTYKVFATVFAVAGLGLMMYMFYVQSGGDLTVFLSEPASIAMVVFPFIPALIFLTISGNAEKQLKKSLEKAPEKAAVQKEAPKEQKKAASKSGK